MMCSELAVKSPWFQQAAAAPTLTHRETWPWHRRRLQTWRNQNKHCLKKIQVGQEPFQSSWMPFDRDSQILSCFPSSVLLNVANFCCWNSPQWQTVWEQCGDRKTKLRQPVVTEHFDMDPDKFCFNLNMEEAKLKTILKKKKNCPNK